MRTIVVWLRNDLRIHDHPALAQAVADGDEVIPLYIVDPAIYNGRHASANRNRFLYECLVDVKQSLQQIGGDLVVRHGKTRDELRRIVDETKAEAVYFTADYSPYAMQRDERVCKELKKITIECRSFPGRLIVSDIGTLTTKSGTAYKVFTPFWKAWQHAQRREISAAPKHIVLPQSITIGSIPDTLSGGKRSDLSLDVLHGGETRARERLQKFIAESIGHYHKTNNDLAANATSRLSAYLHFGCISPLEIETQLPNNEGARAWHRQLAWREFYHYVLLCFPANAQQEFQEKYRNLSWGSDDVLLEAWQTGCTGYPIVDAAMRQLLQEGWMHNRARLIVGSFLTKDLWLDWRLGEAHFMRLLIDGDQANNNGNWQWIASVGVDPAPVYRRLYNPTSQRDTYDPTGQYVRKYVPELQNVPDEYLSEPWRMPRDVQEKAACIIGKDYPAPVVDHADARRAALERYRSV